MKTQSIYLITETYCRQTFKYYFDKQFFLRENYVIIRLYKKCLFLKNEKEEK